MANNSNIRNISLKANCDLSQFGADLHDYNDFAECNSLLVNKRMNAWKKRATSDSEVTADIHYEVDGDDFVLLNASDSEIGRVKREYTKLETIDKSSIPSGLNTVVNPYYSHTTYEPCLVDGKFYDVKVYAHETVGVYDVYWTDTGLKIFKNQVYLADWKFTDYSELTDDYSSTPLTCVLGSEIKSLYSAVAEKVSDNNLYIFATDVLYSYVYEVSDSITSLGTFFTNDYHYIGVGARTLWVSYLYDGVQKHAWSRVYDFKNQVYLYDDLTQSIDTPLSCSVNKQNGKTSGSYSGYVNGFFNHFTSGTSTAAFNKVLHPLNYSVKYGKWAVNYVNNTPENIAYNYHKLFYLNGNQDDDGLCTDIDGYNDDYIYFHTQDTYYRISIDTADDINDILVNVNDYYLIFKTTSYLNAYYLSGGIWFCSCDDWNNRGQWYVTEYSDYWYLLASRCGKPSWLTDDETETVSSQYPAITQRYALTGETYAAYSSEDTWDGESTVYSDDSGTVADTSGWSKGHSLGGYYYISTFTVDPSKMDMFFADDSYTAPEYEYYDTSAKEWKTTKQKYTVYFGDMASSQTQTLQKQGYITCDGWTVEADATEIYSEPTSSTEYQDNPPLLDTKYIIFTQTILADTSHLIYSLLTSAVRRYWLMYNTVEETELHDGDREFVINGAIYVYQSSQNRIVDSNGTWVCNAELFRYIGFSSKYAYFYCEFDKGLYVFNGDNTMTKLTTIEKYQVLFQGSTEDTAITVDSLNLPAIDLVLFNLDDAVGILYGEQFAILQTGTINSWSLNTTYGTFIVNGTMYSLNKYNLEKGNVSHYEVKNVPVKIETEYYGAVGTESNMINDCVYIMLSSLNNSEGDIRIKTKALVNNKVVESRQKTIHLKANDFNSANCCGIKYQPEIQECYGFKVSIESDFEISELKIETSQGAMNQSRFRM